jgi:hypothetical protein
MHRTILQGARRRQWLIAAVTLQCFLFAGTTARAELPLARLATVFPPGAQRGTKVEITLTGTDLDGADRLWFSHPGISAVPFAPTAGGAAAGLKFTVAVDPSVPPGMYDVRAVGLFGVTNPRTFEVGDGASSAAKAGNSSIEAAAGLPLGASMYAAAEANVDHFYHVSVKGQRRLCVQVATTALDSRMEPITTVSDGSGHELGHGHRAGEAIWIDSPEDGICFIRIHDVLYRGGAEYFCRVRVSGDDARAGAEAGALRWPFPPAAAFLDSLPLPIKACDPAGSQGPQPAVTNRRIELPCEMSGQFRGPRQRDEYTFDVPAGQAYWIEIVSQRLGQDTSPFLLVQRIDRDEKGAEKFVDVQELYAPGPPAIIPEFPLGMRDPSYRLEAKQAGTYRLLVRDLFARDRGDNPAVYHLSIRHESPDFELVAIPPSPLPEPADSKDVPTWTTLLRRGGTAPIKVIVVRRDGFTGPITLQVDGLPPEVTAGPAMIPEGSSTATIVLQAGDDARNWVGPITITGTGQTPSGELSRVAGSGVVSFSTYKAETKAMTLLRSRLSDQFVIGVSGVELSPIEITPARETFEAPAGGKVALSFNVKSHADFVSPMILNLAGHPLAVKQLPVDPKADKAGVELDLSQTKLPPGRYTLHFLGQAKLKYPDSPELRAARIVEMSAQNHDRELSEKVLSEARTVGEAIKLKTAELAMSRVRALITSVADWMAAQRSTAAAESHATELAAHAPAKEPTISIYTGAFELNVAPAVGK